MCLEKRRGDRVRLFLSSRSLSASRIFELLVFCIRAVHRRLHPFDAVRLELRVSSRNTGRSRAPDWASSSSTVTTADLEALHAEESGFWRMKQMWQLVHGVWEVEGSVGRERMHP